MGELTPEKIKRGLRWIAHDCDDNGEDCSECECVEECHKLVEDDVARDALDLIEHLEAQQPKWIRVQDVPPKENVYYMVSVTLYGNRGMYTDIAMFDGELWVRDAGSYFDVLDKGDITHYMPLPQPPKEDAE
jgi:hypothetical protein